MQILIIKPSSMGDIIHALPVAQSIRDQIPDAQISWVVKTRFADLIRRCDTVNGRIIEFRHELGLRGIWQTCRELAQMHFDAVLDFQGLLRSGLMTRAAKAPVKIGPPWSRECSSWFHPQVAEFPADGPQSHVIEMMLQFLPLLGLQPELRSPVTIRGDDPSEADPRLRHCSPIVLFPNSRNEQREWRHFPELTERLAKAFPNETFAWDSHRPWDSPAVPNPERFINLTSKTSLMQLVNLIQNAKLIVSNDSGPIHMAAAFGTPTVGLYGPTRPERTGPYPIDGVRNHALVAPNRDLQQLSVDTVFACVAAKLEALNSIRRAA